MHSPCIKIEQFCRGGGIRTHDSPLAAVTDDPRPKVGQILTIDGALPTELRLSIVGLKRLTVKQKTSLFKPTLFQAARGGT